MALQILLAGLAALALIIAGCGSSPGDSSTTSGGYLNGFSGGGTSVPSSTTEAGGAATGTTPLRSAVTTSPVVIPGLRVTVPAGWTINEDNPAAFEVQDQGGPPRTASIWLNARAVKSTGPGPGTPVQPNIGNTPGALVRWFTTTPDFRVVASPRRASIGHVPMTTLVIGASSTARGSDCSEDPHCADVFLSNPTHSHGGIFGIGGNEVVRLFLGHTSQGTVIVGLDAVDPAALKQLETAADPFLNSIRFPS